MAEIQNLGVVLPGDKIAHHLNNFLAHEIFFGPGLDCLTLKVTRPGILNCNEKPDGAIIFWVETHNKKYLDVEPGDIVVGIVSARMAEYLRVDIGTAEPAMLKLLNFQGATKRSKPDIYPGDIVVAKILELTNNNSEAFLTCVNHRTGKSDGLGVITGGGSIEEYPNF